MSVLGPNIVCMSQRAPLSPERAQQIEVALQQVGYRFSSAVRHHWKTATFTNMGEVVEELRGGITATINCRARGRRSTSSHRIRFAPDGSIDLLNHVGDVDEAAERVLSALGSPMGACTAVALCFPARCEVANVGLSGGARQPLDGRLRMLWAAVSWAQDPATVWTPELVDTTLRYGVSLPEARRWVDAGWDLGAARHFWKEWVSFEAAEQWRRAGRTNRSAAIAAGLGEAPEGDQQWLDAGFTLTKAARWRKTSDLTPDEAFMWESLGCPPKEVVNLKRLPRYTPGLTFDTILEWCRAGVPSRATTIRSWWERHRRRPRGGREVVADAHRPNPRCDV